MLITEPLGVVGAPAETLRALQDALDGADLSGATLNFVTDTQDRRDNARYAVLIHGQGQAVLTVEAFGPRFGEEGLEALRQLAQWAESQRFAFVNETVVSTYNFNRILREPDESELRQLIAAANPSDLNIYRR